MCQKARIIVHEPNLGNSAPSESSHGGTNTTRSMFRKAGGELDVMQIQRLLEKNPELGVVVSYQAPIASADKARAGGCDRARRSTLDAHVNSPKAPDALTPVAHLTHTH